MANSKTKGVLPDGPKIKDQRTQAGKSQKGLVDGTVVTVRTLQRAEQGKRILPEMLNAIATALGVTEDQVRLSNGKPAAQNNLAVRLKRLDPPSASRLINFVCSSMNRIVVNFNLDPDEKTAEQLALVVELCEEFRADAERFQMQIEGLSPTQRIRKIGSTNSLLTSLSDQGIYCFYGSYIQWLMQDAPVSAEGDWQIADVEQDKCAYLAFESTDAQYLQRTVHIPMSYESALASAAFTNLKRKIPIQVLREAPFIPDDLIREYERQLANEDANPGEP